MIIEFGRKPRLRIVQEVTDKSAVGHERKDRPTKQLSKRGQNYYAEAKDNTNKLLASVLESSSINVDNFSLVFIGCYLRRDLSFKAIRNDIDPHYSEHEKLQDVNIIRNYENKQIILNAAFLFGKKDRNSENEVRELAWDIANKIRVLARETSPDPNTVKDQLTFPCAMLTRVVGRSPNASKYKPE